MTKCRPKKYENITYNIAYEAKRISEYIIFL